MNIQGQEPLACAGGTRVTGSPEGGDELSA